MHGSGGGGYATIWANDQIEYANPFFQVRLLVHPRRTSADGLSVVTLVKFRLPK